ncbi:leucine-rich repeat extensin-like protein 3 [Iris pallida]|uniref:Leucine-rich repeat extensin-like protein 3 n=1 Tax=Iris pallida TaxID=29817 RepID=A0AAX6GGE9_IRIPA|nr:leucine-rich repeat extensin-like protein 3 [Iris pallida]KAJ6834876.1 leucine-rich repeat extensin-like protein 3 [Iris pallida]
MVVVVEVIVVSDQVWQTEWRSFGVGLLPWWHLGAARLRPVRAQEEGVRVQQRRDRIGQLGLGFSSLDTSVSSLASCSVAIMEGKDGHGHGGVRWL